MLSNAIVETTTTTGTGDLTTSAVTGRPRFTDKPGWASSATEASATHFYYAIMTQDAVPQFIESGIGYMSAVGTLKRIVVLSTYASGTYTDVSASAVSLAAGTKNVFCTGEVGSAGGLSMPGMDNSVSALRYAYSAHTPTQQAGGTLALTANRLYLQPHLHTSSRAIDGIFFRNSGISANARMALFECNRDGTPGRKLMGSTVDLAVTGGVLYVITTGGPVRPAPGWLYLALVCDAAATVNNHQNWSVGPNPMGSDGVSKPFSYGYLANGSTTIADPASAMTTKVTADTAPLGLGVRYGA